jgi:hypothetical protein
MIQDRLIRRTMQAHYPYADRYESSPGAGNTIDVRKSRGVTFILCEGAGGTGTVTVTIQKCDSGGSSGGNVYFQYRANSQTAVGALTGPVATYATIAGANKCVIFYVDAKELSGYGYCTFTLTELVDAACDAGVVAILDEELPI